jgi:hypothetical protein
MQRVKRSRLVIGWVGSDDAKVLSPFRDDDKENPLGIRLAQVQHSSLTLPPLNFEIKRVVANDLLRFARSHLVPSNVSRVRRIPFKPHNATVRQLSIKCTYSVPSNDRIINQDHPPRPFREIALKNLHLLRPKDPQKHQQIHMSSPGEPRKSQIPNKDAPYTLKNIWHTPPRHPRRIEISIQKEPKYQHSVR